jgi:hypothetical protein
MGGKAKSVYLTVCPLGKLQSVFRKTFFDAKSLKEFISTEEFKEKYPADKFQVIKETY